MSELTANNENEDGIPRKSGELPLILVLVAITMEIFAFGATLEGS